MKKAAKTIFILSFLVPYLVSCASSMAMNEQTPEAKKAAAEALLLEQSVLAVNWMQRSGEYRALTYQAFHSARAAFDNAKASNGLKKAVVVDLDETMIDNSAEGAVRIFMHKEFDSELWTKWCEAEEAIAIPGAVDFANYVNSHGGKMFYVSNRKTGAEYEPTLKNLKALGFPGVDENTLLLKSDSSKKTARFEQVEQQGYTIVLFVGDNLDDFGFTNETYHQLNDVRCSVVDKNKADFGVKYIILPNPVYGGWEGGLAGDYYKTTPEGRVKIRHDSLRSWKIK